MSKKMSEDFFTINVVTRPGHLGDYVFIEAESFKPERYHYSQLNGFSFRFIPNSRSAASLDKAMIMVMS